MFFSEWRDRRDMFHRSGIPTPGHISEEVQRLLDRRTLSLKLSGLQCALKFNFEKGLFEGVLFCLRRGAMSSSSPLQIDEVIFLEGLLEYLQTEDAKKKLHNDILSNIDISCSPITDDDIDDIQKLHELPSSSGIKIGSRIAKVLRLNLERARNINMAWTYVQSYTSALRKVLIGYYEKELRWAEQQYQVGSIHPAGLQDYVEYWSQRIPELQAKINILSKNPPSK